MTHTQIHSSVVTVYDNNDTTLLEPSLQPKDSIGHSIEAKILEATGVDYVNESDQC